MSYSNRMQKNNLYSIYFAPRGGVRMVELGMQIAQQYLSPFDHIVGIVGDAGSGKSMLIKGMFPGLDLTNDDSGVHIRPLPLLDIYEESFYSPHTYHLDVQFEAAFTPLHELAAAILEVAKQEKRVIVEHFEMVYPLLGRNADLLIGVGEEILITRPNIFGPEPSNIADIVYRSIRYRKMAHTAEDLCVMMMDEQMVKRTIRSDVRHGFVLEFPEKPNFNIVELESRVKALIDQDIEISFADDNHVLLGDTLQVCQAPRMHISSAGKIEQFSLVKEFVYEPKTAHYLLIGQVGKKMKDLIRKLNTIDEI